MRYRSIIIAFLTLSMLSSGCSQKKQSPQPQPQALQDEQQQDKAPDQLTEIEMNIEKIIKSLEGPSVAPEEKKEGQEKENTQDGQNKKTEAAGSEQNKEVGQGKQEGQGQEGGSQGNKSSQGQEQSSPQPKQQKQPQQQDPWQQISPLFNNLHYQWNDYMPLAMKAGASKNLIDNFSNSLNSLTNTILTKNKTNTLLAANSLFAFISDFYFLYKTKTSPEIKKIRYYIRDAMINAMTANWTQADSDINNLKSSWSMYKTTVSKEQQEVANKLDLSIYELERVIREKNQPLIDIKGRVALSNVEATEKSAEKSSGQGKAK